MFLSLFHAVSGLQMGDAMDDCPLMAQEEVVCAMSAGEHLAAWKSLFLSILPSLLLLVTVAHVLAVGDLHQLRIRVFHIPIVRALRPLHISLRLYWYLSILFARGILHPKLF